jgi:hypothetical protein
MSVYNALQEHPNGLRFNRLIEASKFTVEDGTQYRISPKTVRGILRDFCDLGKTIYDKDTGVYRLKETQRKMAQAPEIGRLTGFPHKYSESLRKELQKHLKWTGAGRAWALFQASRDARYKENRILVEIAYELRDATEIAIFRYLELLQALVQTEDLGPADKMIEDFFACELYSPLATVACDAWANRAKIRDLKDPIKVPKLIRLFYELGVAKTNLFIPPEEREIVRKRRRD